MRTAPSTIRHAARASSTGSPRTAGSWRSQESAQRPRPHWGFPRFDPERSVQMAQQVSDYVLERLTEWGIHRIFGYPGDGINAFLGALDRAEGDPSSSRCATRRWRRSWPAATRSSPARSGSASRPPARARSISSTASTTRSSTTSRRRDRRPAEADVARRPLPAGGRPELAVQGRRRVREGAARVPARRAISRPRAAGSRSASRGVATIIVPNDVAGAERRRGAATHARRRLLERRLHPRRGCCRRRPTSSARPRSSTRGEGRDARRPGRARRRRRGGRASPTCSAPGSPRRCSARTCCPTTSRS